MLSTGSSNIIYAGNKNYLPTLFFVRSILFYIILFLLFVNHPLVGEALPYTLPIGSPFELPDTQFKSGLIGFLVPNLAILAQSGAMVMVLST